MSDFDSAVITVLQHEGGYINNPRDPGAETCFGISKRSYPNINIRNITRGEATEIYFRDWWQKFGYCNIRDQHLATKIFDAAVNIGAKKAHQLLQRAITSFDKTILIDGICGKQTFQAIQELNEENLTAYLIDRFRILLSHYYLELTEINPANRIFLHGWLKRALS